MKYCDDSKVAPTPIWLDVQGKFFMFICRSAHLVRIRKVQANPLLQEVYIVLYSE